MMETAAAIRRRAVPFAALLSILTLVVAPVAALAQTKWSCAVTKAEFRRRSSHQVLVFDNKLWVLNGIGSKKESRADTNIISFHDTWHSTTGATWTKGADNVPYSIAAMFVALVFNGQMWICGGHEGC